MHRLFEWLHRAGLFTGVTVNVHVQNLQIVNTGGAAKGPGPKGDLRTSAKIGRPGTIRRLALPMPAVARRPPPEIHLLTVSRPRPSDALIKESSRADWAPIMKGLEKRR
jgi:hypothetical protein